MSKVLKAKVGPGTIISDLVWEIRDKLETHALLTKQKNAGGMPIEDYKKRSQRIFHAVRVMLIEIEDWDADLQKERE